MPFCPSCGAQFRAGYTQCNTCHVPLVDSLNGDAHHEVAEADDAEYEATLLLLTTLNDEPQAVYVRRLLDDAGIPSIMVGGHAPNIGQCEPYRLLVDEDYFEAAQETIESFNSPSLVTGQIEGNLARLESELNRLAGGQDYLAPHLQAVRESLGRLQRDLSALNQELNEEG